MNVLSVLLNSSTFNNGNVMCTLPKFKKKEKCFCSSFSTSQGSILSYLVFQNAGTRNPGRTEFCVLTVSTGCSLELQVDTQPDSSARGKQGNNIGI